MTTMTFGDCDPWDVCPALALTMSASAAEKKKKEEVDASNTEYYEWKAFAFATTSGYMF